MMNKRRTKGIGRTKYIMFLPLAALLLIISNIEIVARTTGKFAKEVMEQVAPAQPELVNIPPLKTEKMVVPDSVVFEVVEVMPEFPGGMSALMQYMAKSIKYPAEAQAQKEEGRVIASFIVRKDGSLSDIKIVRSVAPSLDKEALRVLSAMPKWKPGLQRGEAVNVRFTVPVVFKLNKPEAPKAEEIKNSDLEEVVVVGYGNKNNSNPEAVGIKTGDTESVFKVVETMPKFPGGVAGLMKYLARSIKYPVIAQENKEQGRVILKMIVGKDGSISNIEVLRSISASLDAEAIRVVSNMPKWEPGLQRGQAVAVEYTLPITFKLQ